MVLPNDTCGATPQLAQGGLLKSLKTQLDAIVALCGAPGGH